MSKQRLILLFDGTWNDPQDQTNVYRLASRLKDYDGNIAQQFFYDPGVGTCWWDRLLGGMTGYGLSRNLLQGYDWLARHYAEGDEIWVFGFSRGAYTARSLVGLIRKCGLLHIVTPDLQRRIEAIYRDKTLQPESAACCEFRAYYSHEPRIHFIGVWDTVGALGVPGTLLSECGRYAWHDTSLSKIVDHAYHALALDECREPYRATLWTSPDGHKKAENLDVQQRWFIGAHANVGGGYGPQDPLPDIPLEWLLDHARACGLKLDAFEAPADAWRATPRDAFREFLGGLYARYRRLRCSGDGRYHRAYDQGFDGSPAINISVDASVWQRWHADPGYRPATLIEAGLAAPDAQP